MNVIENIIEILGNGDIKKEEGLEKCLDVILPRKKEGFKYSHSDIERHLLTLRDEIQSIQMQNNDEFDQVLDESTYVEMQNLYQNLHNIQLEVMRLQCDIAFTKEQYDTMVATCDNPTVQNHRNILNREAELRKIKKQIIYKPLVDFYDRFTKFLQSTETVMRGVCLNPANFTNNQQLFDWLQYKQLIFLIRSTGRSILELDRFERLYQSDIQIIDISFKQPLDQMNFDDFIQLYEDCSLETQVEVLYGNSQRPVIFNELKLVDIAIQSIIGSSEPVSYTILDVYYRRLRLVVIEFTRILIDMNMNYIDAYLTKGINVDILNGDVYATLTGPQEGTQQKPTFAYSPQEYITQIGQHLLTLRAQTEPYDRSENGYLRFALQNSMDQMSSLKEVNPKMYSSITGVVMRAITHLCIKSVLGRTGQSILSKLTPDGRRQLSTDVLYLDNVLDDLGLLDLQDPYVIKFKSLLTQ